MYAVTQIVENCIEGLKVFLASMYNTGKELVGQLIDAMAEKFEEIYTKASEWVQDNILSPITEKGKELFDAGKNLIDQMWQGLKEAWSSVTAWWDGLSFSSKTAKATVRTSGVGINGSHANGLDYVPFDNYVAKLHKGETVLTAREADAYRKGKNGNGVTFSGGINITYNANGETDEESVKKIAQMLQFELEREMHAFA